jgi:ubiquinone/menaquinone biosynthesis C-methylase UbiE
LRTGFDRTTLSRTDGSQPFKKFTPSTQREVASSRAPRTQKENDGVRPVYKPVYKSVTPNKPRTASASWGTVASWYDKHLNEADTYHEKVIRPNLVRLIDAKAEDSILDIACGQGYFARALTDSGAKVTGIDIGEELITLAKSSAPKAEFVVGSANDLSQFSDKNFTKALCVLAIQNMEDIDGMLSEAARVLAEGGSLDLVLNHPAFRIPKQSAWGYDDKKKVQWRRVDEYLSSSRSEIDMHPGMDNAPKTLSFHRPLQFYFKAFAKAGFAVTRLEEWISYKTSDSGPRAKAENNARKEIPLFLYLKLQKI